MPIKKRRREPVGTWAPDKKASGLAKNNSSSNNIGAFPLRGKQIGRRDEDDATFNHNVNNNNANNKVNNNTQKTGAGGGGESEKGSRASVSTQTYAVGGERYRPLRRLDASEYLLSCVSVCSLHYLRYYCDA